MSLHQLQDIALEYFQALNTPIALSQAIRLRYGDWEGIARASVDPRNYLDAHSYRLDNYAVTLLKKCAGLPTGIDTRAEALKEWAESEESCAKTNARLADDEMNFINEKFFLRLQKNFARLVGRPPVGKPDIRFGPGSTFELSGKHVTVPDKIAALPSFTINAATYIYDYRETAWGRRNANSLFPESPLHDVPLISEKLPRVGGAGLWVDQLRPIRAALNEEFVLVQGNRWDSAPKSALVDRSIGIEAGGNMVYQLACGKAMRRGLNRHGLLLRPFQTEGSWDWQPKAGQDSQQIHRALACKGSVDDSIATLDVRKASDTQCYQLIKRVAGKWWPVLEELRSPCTEVFGHDISLDKFSSMGNGYTFELETALFASIAMTMADVEGVQLIPNVNFSVYGDDIIVPVELAEMMTAALAYCGFELNKSKSYVSGSFRESCGGDFFNGSAVRGLYLKQLPESVGQWITFHNLVKRAETHVPMAKVLDKVRANIPVSCRNYGPVSFGDVVMHHARWPERAKLKRDANQCSWLKITVPEVESYTYDRWDVLSIVASKVYGITGDEIALRGDPISFHAHWVSFG